LGAAFFFDLPRGQYASVRPTVNKNRSSADSYVFGSRYAPQADAEDRAPTESTEQEKGVIAGVSRAALKTNIAYVLVSLLLRYPDG
jgi:hypothetical protein